MLGGVAEVYERRLTMNAMQMGYEYEKERWYILWKHPNHDMNVTRFMARLGVTVIYPNSLPITTYTAGG